MATLLIDNLTTAELTITNTDSYDVLILPEAEGIATSGRVISTFARYDVDFDAELASYGLALGKDDVVLTIAGNYRQSDSKDNSAYMTHLRKDGADYEEDFASQYTNPVDLRYNVYHISFNDGYTSGAIKFKGSNANLILSAQSGAGMASKYHKAVDDSGAAIEGMMKTDDGIAIRSDNYGIYTRYNNSGSRIVYNQPGNPVAPESLTENYTIHALNDLTVKSDLAGQISANNAVLHLGYSKVDGENIVIADDSSGNNSSAAAIKAANLILENNFRADIDVKNNEDTLKAALCGVQDDKRIEYGDNVEASGSSIVAIKAPAADNNTIAVAGISVSGSITMRPKSVWAGSIDAEVEGVAIIASADYLIQEGENAPDASKASASGNTISAVGIKADGTVSIAEMGSLLKDDNGVDAVEIQSAEISAKANNNSVQVKAVSAEGEASAAINTKITAVAIEADVVNLGKVSDVVKISAEAKNNTFAASASGTGVTISGAVESSAVGIKAGILNVDDFDGVIVANADNGNNDSSVDFDYYATGIAVGTLNSGGNLKGTITVSARNYDSLSLGGAVGIIADSIKVNGVIDTVINANMGIHAERTITAAGFTGDINAMYGINIATGGLTGEFATDTFDIAGNIGYNWSSEKEYIQNISSGWLDLEASGAIYGVVALYAINIRVSGNISALKEDVSVMDQTLFPRGNAILAEHGLNQNGSIYRGETKNNDYVEIVSGATVTGDIDLCAGVNNIVISSGANVQGAVLAANGEINITFNLENESNTAAALSMGAFNNADKTLMDSSTITVNINYAAAGNTYKLLSYGFNASEYWAGRQLAFVYQNNEATVKLDENCSGEAEIYDADGNVTAKVSVSFNGTELSVSVNEKTELVEELWALEDTDLYVLQDYDAEKRVLSLDWSEAERKIEADEFGLHEISCYEIEYKLFDKDGNALGSSLAVKLDGKKTGYDIAGVDNNTEVKWRMRLLGDASASSSTQWSDWFTVSNAEGEDLTTFVDTSCEFDFTNFTTQVLDANPGTGRENISGVVAAIATIGWDGIEADQGIRKYVIEYSTSTRQLTIDDARDAGFDTLEEYIANGMKMSYTKVVSGNTAAISNLQNQTFVYWRIKAVDVYGNTSDWVAGNTFRVWANNDTSKPVFKEDQLDTGFIASFVLPDDSNVPAGKEPFSGKTTLAGAIGWHAAVDTQSGVRAYIIETSTDGGNTYNHWKTVGAEEFAPRSIATWESSSLDRNTSYRVIVDGQESSLAEVKVTIAGSREILSLNWIGEGDFTGKSAQIEYLDANGNWQVLQSVEVGGFEFTVYDYIVKLDGMTDPSFSYRIKAVDYFGSESDYIGSTEIVVDSKAPVFSNDKCDIALNVNNSDPEKITVKPTFTWSPAQDYASDLGVRYYEVFYCTPGGEWISAGTVSHVDGANADGLYSLTFAKAVAAQKYDYKIVAYDFFGREAVIAGSFGSSDFTGPAGEFLENYFTAEVNAVYKQIPTVDEEENSGSGDMSIVNPGSGNMSIVNPGSGNMSIVNPGSGNMSGETDEPVVDDVEPVKELVAASVVLSWRDSFTDPSGVVYKVTVSDDEYFSSERTYDFWTESSSLNFDSSTVGRPVGIFEGMKKVYWYVEAYDTNGNKAAMISDTQSFEFKDQDGVTISSTVAPAKPSAIKLDLDNMENGLHTDVIGLSWTAATTPMGAYYYEIALYDEDGGLVISGTTLDTANKGNTDVNSNVKVTSAADLTSATLEIADLRKFFGTTAIDDGKYTLKITAYDANGGKTVSDSQKFTVDTIGPEQVKITEACAVVDKRNNNGDGANSKINIMVLKWEEPYDKSGIDHYLVSYRPKTEANDGGWTVKKVSKTEFELQVAIDDVPYQFRVVAVDKAGNIGMEWSPSKMETISPVNDKYADSGATVMSFDSNNQLAIADSVGRGDKADIISVDITDKPAALTVTASKLNDILGTNGKIKIDVYEGSNLKKVWKSYTVSDVSRVFTDLLLQADTTYTFKISAAGSSNVVDYDLVFDKMDLPADNTDDTYVLANNNGQIITVNGSDAALADWVGFGDNTDVRILNVEASGIYTFNLNGVAASTVLTVYEMVNGTKKSLGKVTATQSTLSGVSTKEILLEKGRNYFVEVKASNGKLLGSDYNVSIDCVQSFRTEDSADGKIGVVNSNTNPVDYYEISEITDAGVYTIKLTGTNGKNIKAAVGYLMENGKFKSVISKTGTAGADELIISGELPYSQAELAAMGTKLYVQISANGKNSYSNYDIEVSKNSEIAGYDNSDDTLQSANGELKIGEANAVHNWVGLGDAADYTKLALSGNGIYKLSVGNVENPVTVTVYDANGKSLATAKLTAADSAKVIDNMLLDASKEYYVGVVATGAKSGNNSDYKLVLEQKAAAVALADLTENDVAVTAEGSSWIFNAPEKGGACCISVNAEDVSKAGVKLTVYELLTNGRKRTVKSVTVKPGAESSTGYLYFGSDAVNNGTGIYQVEVKAAGKNSAGVFDISVDGYDFGGYLENADGAIETSVKNWVGKGDASDSYDFTAPATNAGVYSLNLSGINGNNIKLYIVDSNNKVVKSFTPAAKATDASFSFDFAGENYKIIVASADNGKNKFSEYVFDYVDRTGDIALKDNSYRELYDNSGTTGKAVAAGSGWVGLNDKADFYRLAVDADGIYSIDLSGIGNNVKFTLCEAVKFNDDGSVKSVKNVVSSTVKAENGGAGFENLQLSAGKEYYVVLQATAVDGKKDTDYDWSLTQDWTFADKATDNNSIEKAADFSGTADSAVWGSGDNADYYKIDVAADGSCYVFDLTGIAGGNIKFALGTNSKGSFKSIASGKTVGDAQRLVAELDAGTYYIKVESTGKNKASGYTLAGSNNSALAGFDNSDDTWKQTAAKILDSSDIYSKANNVISDWVGFGDSADTFMINLAENGVVSFAGDAFTAEAFNNKELTLAMVDANGKSIALSFDDVAGTYTTKTVLAADVDYFLTVKNTKSDKCDIDYQITIL